MNKKNIDYKTKWADKATNRITKMFATGELPNSFPEQLQLDLTRFCSNKLWVNKFLKGFKTEKPPLDCLNCSFPQEKINYHIPFEVFKNIIKNYSAGLGKAVFISGGGEPAEYPNFIPALKELAAASLNFSFNTWGLGTIKINQLPAEELQNLYRLASVENMHFVSVSVHELNNDQIFMSLENLAKKFYLNNLAVVLRTSFLIHEQTKINELKIFINKSRENGVRIISFKPAWTLNKQNIRQFNKNKKVYNYLMNYQAKYDNQLDLLRIDRLINPHIKRSSPFCFAPLEKMYVNIFGQCTMCCDTKDESQGKTKTTAFLNSFPENPEEYYKAALSGIKKFRDWSNCVQGCNSHELNESLFNKIKQTDFFKK